jgi:hypothetical protein
MKDWKGNEIQVGDTVLKVRIAKPFENVGNIKCVEFDAHGNSEVLVEWERPKKRQYLWLVEETYKIESGAHWGIEITKEHNQDWMLSNEQVLHGFEHTKTFGIDAIELIEPQPYEILCIVGKSDNMDEYYLKEFEV